MRDAEYFRKCGIHLIERKPEPTGYLICAWFLFWLVCGGSMLYGMLLGAEWVFRALGVEL